MLEFMFGSYICKKVKPTFVDLIGHLDHFDNDERLEHWGRPAF